MQKPNSNVNLDELNEAQNNQFDLSVILRLVRRNLWIVIVCACLALVAGYYLSKDIKPVYTASAKILANPFQPNGSTEEQRLASSMVFLFFETQFGIIRSRVIAETVVDKLNFVEFTRNNAQTQESTFAFIDPIKDAIFPILGLDTEKEKEELNDSQLRALLAQTISSNVEVSGGRTNQIITLSYSDTSPTTAAVIVNAIADAYIEFGLTTRLNDVKSRQSWLTTQYEQLQKNLEESERKVKEFREQQGLIGSDEQRAMANTQLQNLNASLVTAQTELSRRSEEFALVELIKGGSRDFSALAQVMQNSVISNLVQRVAVAQSNVDELAKRYGEKHPRMIAANVELDSTSRSLEREVEKVIEQIEDQYNLAKTQVENINKLINETKDEVQGLTGESFALISLEREVENNRRIYESFQSRLLEVNVSSEVSTSNVHIIDRAIPPRVPESSSVKKIIFFSGIGGIMLGIGIALIRELANNTFTTPELVEEKLRYPVLGITPLLKKKKGMRPEMQYLDDSRSPFAESINSIRTGLLFSNIDNPPKTILITSGSSAEGKSTLALNLAAAFSKLGKTILLEVDLRKPNLAINLERPKTKGITDVLSGSVETFKEAVISEIGENLDILTCGTVPHNPMELLQSQKFSKLLEALKIKYQFIVLDGPPTLPVSDACVIGSKVDAVLVSVRAEKTKIKAAKQTVSRLSKLNSNIVGTVLTIAERKKMSYYGVDYHAGEYYGNEKRKSNIV